MDEFFDQIERSLVAEIYYLALAGALCVPDICAALEAPDGRTSGERYIDWCRKHLEPKWARPALPNGPIEGLVSPTHTPTAEECYYFRCSLLHQGSVVNPRRGFHRLIFVEPSYGGTFHNNIINDALNLDIRIFVRQILEAARAWEAQIRQTPEYRRNISRTIRRYPNGLSPYFGGIPVIA